MPIHENLENLAAKREPAELGYYAEKRRVVPQPGVAVVGFLLFGFSFAVSPMVFWMIGYLVGPQFLMVTSLALSVISHSGAVAGAFMVIHALRRSRLLGEGVQSALRVLLIAYLGLLLIGAVYRMWQWYFYTPMVSPILGMSPVFLLGRLAEGCLAAFMMLWGVYLWRVGRAVQSASLGISGCVAAGLQAIVHFAYMATGGGYALGMVGRSGMTVDQYREIILALSYANGVTVLLLAFQSAWCAWVVGRFVRKERAGMVGS